MTYNPAKTTLAVDLTDIIMAYSALPSMLDFYAYYPLRNMIQDLYRDVPKPGGDELFHDNFISLVPEYKRQDSYACDLFIENLSKDMDVIVGSAMGDPNGGYTYIVKGWLNANSVLLEVNDYALYNPDRRQY